VVGGHLVSAPGLDTLTVVSVTLDRSPRRVHNLEVRNLHSYAVGELGEWVHNGRVKNKLKPDPNASGDHWTFKTDPNGQKSGQRWIRNTNPCDPAPWKEGIRVKINPNKGHSVVGGDMIVYPSGKARPLFW
jgi:hypothetical protein